MGHRQVVGARSFSLGGAQDVHVQGAVEVALRAGVADATVFAFDVEQHVKQLVQRHVGVHPNDHV